MLKFIFWVFFLINGALLAFRFGYFDPLFASKGEPQRMENQLNVDSIRLVSNSAPQSSAASVAEAAPPAAVSASTPGAAAPAASVAAPVGGLPKAPLACTEIGEFTLPEAKRIEPRLAALALGDRQSRRNIREAAGYIVFIPPLGNKAAIDSKVAELKRLGVSSYFVIQDNSSLRTGISLGVFKTEAAARAQLNGLSKKGVRSARIGVRSMSTSRVAYQLRNLDAAALQALDKILTDFPAQKKRECVKD